VAKLIDLCSQEVIGFCQETRTYQPSFVDYSGKDYDFSTVSGAYTIHTGDHAVSFSYFYADNPISNSDKELHYIDGIVNGGWKVHSGATVTLREDFTYENGDVTGPLQLIYLCQDPKIDDCGLPGWGDGDDDDDDDDEGDK
jgi:hypothetical protein